MSSTSSSVAGFRRIVWAHYKKHGRHDLPWRPPSLKLRKGKEDEVVYKILVSEVMLQQTQVERVLPFYKSFLKKFPTAKTLAAAPLSEVLAAWQGLGYNRRAKLLRDAAKEMSKNSMIYHTGDTDMLVRTIEQLPGVGPYTARAVAAFAYNADVVFIETNIRTVITHHFFARSTGKSSSRGAQAARPIQPLAKNLPAPLVNDREILAILEEVLPKGRAREWYSALMDYGAHLKRTGVRTNARSAQYTKQTKFEGSLRQVRGAIVRALTKGESLTAVKKKYPHHFDAALAGLAKDGMIKKKGRGWEIG